MNPITKPLNGRRSLRPLLTKAWLATLAFLLVAASPGFALALAGAPVTINIGSSLDPSSITIEPGTSVTWVNNDSERHRMASQEGPERFDSGNLEPGQSFTMVFDLEGTYSYLDDRDDENSAYFGTIVVSSGAPSTPPPGDGGGPGAGPVSIDIGDRIYRPASVTVSPGTTITWRNSDDRPHTVTDRAGSFDSGIFDTGGTYTRTFDTPGTYQYFCTLHPDMVGTVSVTGADGGAPPPPAPAPPPTTPPPPPPPPSGPGAVSIFDNGYTPSSLSVTEGTTVTWTNTGAAPHTATDRSGRFDSGFLMTGDSYSQTFTTAGTYEYFCTIHPEMVATITVTGAGGAPPPPPPPPTDPTPPPVPSPVAPAPGGIEIVDNAFRPPTREVSVGTTLVWTNTGALPHTVTDRAGRFDSGLMMTGNTYQRTFDTAGTFEYFCTLHPEMVGTIVVVGSDGAAPPPPPPAAPAPAPSAATPSGGTPGASDVRMIDNDYQPGTITVARGSTLTFANAGALPHTVTDRAGSFDSGIVMPGQSYRRTFSAAGTFEYFCTIHPEMTGTVVVTASGTPVGTASAGGDGVVDGAGAESTTTTSEAATATTTADVRPARASVDVIDNDFDPNPLRIAPGTTVSWTNIGDLPHTVTAEGFDSGIMSGGDSFEWTFTEVGTFDYVCTLHPGMAGTVIVDAAFQAASDDSTVAAGSSSGSNISTSSAATSPGNSVALAVFMALGLAVAGVGMAVGVGRFAKAIDNGTIG